MTIGELLIRKGTITQEQLQAAMESRQKADERLHETLVRLGYATESDVVQAFGELTGLPVVELSRESIPSELVASVPPRYVFQKKFIPLRKEDGSLTIAIADALDIHAIDELRLLLGCNIRPVIAKASEIAKLTKRYYGIGADTVDQMLNGARDDVVVVDEKKQEDRDILEMAEDASLIKFVNQILVEAFHDRATDVHIEPFEEELRIRYRIDGVLHRASVPAQIRQFQAAITSRLKIMASLNIAEKRLPQDGRIKLLLAGREIDVRVSVIPTLFGEGIVLRLLDRASMFYDLEQLGMSPKVLSQFERLIKEPHGIVLVTGPTGSGKTTTLYAALQKLNSLERKIVTIEDPVEYQLSGVNQIQVKPKIGLSFANGLRYILRHDPNVILVGEIRDLETAEIAIQAALTGHLVFSTLHTNDAPGAVTRLVDMGIEPFLISSSVEGILAQRLVRVICGNCKKSLPRGDYPLLDEVLPKDITIVYRGAGCPECKNTGFKGRTGIFELMTVGEEGREVIMDRTQSSRLRRFAIDHGMQPIRTDGWEKVNLGITTPEEVLRVTKSDRLASIELPPK